VVAGSYWGQPDGQVMYILAISLAAAEASIGLALLLQLHRRRQSLNIDSVKVRCVDEPSLVNHSFCLLLLFIVGVLAWSLSENLSATVGVGSIGLTALVDRDCRR